MPFVKGETNLESGGKHKISTTARLSTVLDRIG